MMKRVCVEKGAREHRPSDKLRPPLSPITSFHLKTLVGLCHLLVEYVAIDIAIGCVLLGAVVFHVGKKRGVECVASSREEPAIFAITQIDMGAVLISYHIFWQSPISIFTQQIGGKESGNAF